MQEIDEKLADRALWLSAPGEVLNVKTLQEASDLWTVVSRVEDALGGLLREVGLLAADEGPTPYSAPVYFVGGRYFPSLSEHFWKLLHEIRNLEGQQEAAKTAATQGRLTAKWDAN